MLLINFLKKFFKLLFKLILVLLGSLTLFILFYKYNNTLFIWEAKILFGNQQFSETKFKNGSLQDRASMSANIIETKYFIGKDIGTIHDKLGEETGDYYYSDSNVTYNLTNKGGADWVLTFLSDSGGNVKRVFIRKSCCSISWRIANFIIDKAGGLIVPILIRRIKERTN